MIKISVVNHSTLFPDSDLKTLADVLQIQVTRDFFPIWGINAKMYYTPKGSHPTADHWALGIFDDADAADALGYHDVTVAGLPLGKVFVRPTLAQGSRVEATASHECLEMLGDPDINLTVVYDDGSGVAPKLYSYEVCDSPEADAYNYLIETDGKQVPVSDFVFPAWFESFRKVGPYDFQNQISRPFQILPGGYMSYLDLGNQSLGWQQEFARHVQELRGNPQFARTMAFARPRPGSRRSRRALPRKQWLVSRYNAGSDAVEALLPSELR